MCVCVYVGLCVCVVCGNIICGASNTFKKVEQQYINIRHTVVQQEWYQVPLGVYLCRKLSIKYKVHVCVVDRCAQLYLSSSFVRVICFNLSKRIHGFLKYV